MVVKFLTVVSYFMHLKFDNKIFSFMFYLGLVLAVVRVLRRPGDVPLLRPLATPIRVFRPSECRPGHPLPKHSDAG